MKRSIYPMSKMLKDKAEKPIEKKVIGDEKYGNYAINRAFGEKHQRLQAFSITLSFKSGSPLYYLDGKEISVQKEFGCP